MAHFPTLLCCTSVSLRKKLLFFKAFKKVYMLLLYLNKPWMNQQKRCTFLTPLFSIFKQEDISPVCTIFKKELSFTSVLRC